MSNLLSVGIVVPVYQEREALPALIEALAPLRAAGYEILLVDGGSTDGSPALIHAAGLTCITAPRRGRAAQINTGVAAMSASYLCVLHADTLPPQDLADHMRRTLADPTTSLAGFRPVMRGVRFCWATSLHNLAKTWYAPLLFRPHLFVRGCRLLFGDHAMFFRRADFLAVHGFDESLEVMEEADLCIKLSRHGRVRLLWTPVYSSDRRVRHWGPLRANLIYIILGVMWGLGFKRRLGRYYPDIR